MASWATGVGCVLVGLCIALQDGVNATALSQLCRVQAGSKVEYLREHRGLYVAWCPGMKDLVTDAAANNNRQSARQSFESVN